MPEVVGFDIFGPGMVLKQRPETLGKGTTDLMEYPNAKAECSFES
jgi:hypothetical protein